MPRKKRSMAQHMMEDGEMMPYKTHEAYMKAMRQKGGKASEEEGRKEGRPGLLAKTRARKGK